MFNFGRSTFTDAEILSGIREGVASLDPYIKFLYKQHKRPVFKYVQSNSGSAQDAREILHEGIIRLFEQLIDKKFQGKSSIGSYLFTICRNLWISRRQKGSRMTVLGDEAAAALPGYLPDPETWLERKELKVMVAELLESVGEQCRKLLVWSDGEGRPMAWIAKELGLSGAQVAMNKKSKCKKKLKEKVRVHAGYRAVVREVVGGPA